MIKSKESIKDRGIEIDLTGPDGNAFYILGVARQWAKQLDYDEEELKDLLDDMRSSDYEHLVNVFDETFGDFVTIYR